MNTLQYQHTPKRGKIYEIVKRLNERQLEQHQILYNHICSNYKHKLQSYFKHLIVPFSLRKDFDWLGTFLQIVEMSTGPSQERSILIHGEEEGVRRWEEYRKIQALTNTYEYKKEKYGMSKQSFDEYNSSRSQTLNNMIHRHGETVGKEKWLSYCDIQSTAGVSEIYWIEKLGEELGRAKHKEVCASKAQTLNNMIRRHGETVGKEKWLSYVEKTYSFYSKSSQDFILLVEHALKKYNMCDIKTYYATHPINRSEYGMATRDGYIKLDYVVALPGFLYCLEYDGDHWHANPKLYKSDDIPPMRGNTTCAKKIWENDEKKLKNILTRFDYCDKIFESEATPAMAEKIAERIDYLWNLKQQENSK